MLTLGRASFDTELAEMGYGVRSQARIYGPRARKGEYEIRRTAFTRCGCLSLSCRQRILDFKRLGGGWGIFPEACDLDIRFEPHWFIDIELDMIRPQGNKQGN